jgi:signal transduction histidine kinase
VAGMEIIIVIVLVVAIFCCVLTVLFCRRYMLNTFDSIDAVLDWVLSKNTDILSDITDENRISKLTYKAHRIVDMVVSEVKYTKEEKETIQSFISDMSHQMKTPLSGIAVYTDLLSEGNLSNEEQREFIARIKSGTDKLQWMMDNLIKMSRLEAEAIQLAPVPENIRQTISDAIGSVVAAAIQKNIDIIVSDFDDFMLYHDRKWTREVIANVLENAVKYSPPDKSIKVSVERMTLYSKIDITDYGIGIEKNDWNLIFKRFYRSQNVKEHEGAGLGLYLANLIMEKQGGYIMVDSIPGEFTCFSLFLQNNKK